MTPAVSASAQRDLPVGQPAARPPLLRGERFLHREGGGQPLGELGRRLLHVLRTDPARQVPDRHGEPVSTEGAHEPGALAEAGAARRVQPGESVQKPLLRVGHHPAQVVLLRGLAPVRGVHPGQPHRRDRGRVGPLQGGGDLRRGVLRVRHPELEAAVHHRLERALGVDQFLQPGAVGGGASPLHRGARLRHQRALERVGQVAADVAGGRVVLQAEQDRAVVAAQGRPGHRQHRGERDRRDVLGQAVLQGQLDRRGRDQLAQRHPVALAGQALERAPHQLGHGVRGLPAVARLVAPATAAGAGLTAADHRNGTVGARPAHRLRALGLGLGSLLGHRGCLPVTARLVRREPSRSHPGRREPVDNARPRCTGWPTAPRGTVGPASPSRPAPAARPVPLRPRAWKPSGQVLERFREIQTGQLGQRGRGDRRGDVVAPAAGVRVVHVPVDHHPDRHLAADVVAHAPVVGERRDDVQSPAPVRRHRGGGRRRAGRAPAVRDLHDEPAPRIDPPRGPYAALPGRVVQRPAVFAGIAQQFRKDQYGIVDHRFRHASVAQLRAHPAPRVPHARRAMGYGHARRRGHLLCHHQRHPRDLLRPTPRCGCPTDLCRKPANPLPVTHSARPYTR
ncbi:hypothetical protein SGPA1_50166 [Streptomyces misionensis JCM 4497]